MPKNLSDTEIREFRRRLCAVAERRFAERGADGVSMRQLAQELGCSAMTPYRYFRDKDEILAAVRAAAFDRFATALETAAKLPGDARAKGRAVGEAYLRFAFGESNAYRLMFDLSQPGGDRFPDLVRASARARRTMSAYVEALVGEGALDGDPDLLGYVFWAAVHGLVVLHLAGKLPGKPDFQTLYRTTMHLLAEGTRHSAAPPQRRAGAAKRR
ncbi:MAG TPA: TetR/AcrR family transcriptional regulator [Stellaceae bacterium]|nr:TetR/AcrR family transcriptional regulator [Stellaceae bacterium]